MQTEVKLFMFFVVAYTQSPELASQYKDPRDKMATISLKLNYGKASKPITMEFTNSNDLDHQSPLYGKGSWSERGAVVGDARRRLG